MKTVSLFYRMCLVLLVYVYDVPHLQTQSSIFNVVDAVMALGSLLQIHPLASRILGQQRGSVAVRHRAEQEHQEGEQAQNGSKSMEHGPFPNHVHHPRRVLFGSPTSIYRYNVDNVENQDLCVCVIVVMLVVWW